MTSEHWVQVGGIPTSVEDFVAVRDEVAGTPEGGAVMMVVALLVYTEDEAVGRQCLTVAVDRKRLQEGAKGYKGWQLHARDLQMIRLQLGGRSYMPRSYVEGAVPENGYGLPEPPYRFRFVPDPRSGERGTDAHKVFIVSSGADSARPVTLHRNPRGIWKAYEWSSLVMGVRPPAADADDEL